MSDVKVYGTEWRAMTCRSLAHLDAPGVACDYIDVDKDPEASEWIKSRTGGSEKKPVLDIAERC